MDHEPGGLKKKGFHDIHENDFSDVLFQLRFQVCNFYVRCFPKKTDILGSP